MAIIFTGMEKKLNGYYFVEKPIDDTYIELNWLNILNNKMMKCHDFDVKRTSITNGCAHHSHHETVSIVKHWDYLNVLPVSWSLNCGPLIEMPVQYTTGLIPMTLICIQKATTWILCSFPSVFHHISYGNKRMILNHKINIIYRESMQIAFFFQFQNRAKHCKQIVRDAKVSKQILKVKISFGCKKTLD